ncbi:Origin recognition complex subunit 2 [Merluccius polli]|uniref:Origin recognition complex subunit 2 n=1 Tax=Merluccius polli TaxID=89951 RepID=A0AA47M6G2_MERPO|nr:Origin recognition complex subunit 2 [Merluccius polli]
MATELRVKFVGDDDVLEHIVDHKEAVRAAGGSVQRMVTFGGSAGRRAAAEDDDEDEDEDEVLDEQKYVQALGADSAAGNEELGPGVTGAAVFSFQKVKRSQAMAQRASELARTPGKSVTFNAPADTEPTTPVRSGRNSKNENRTPQKGRKVQFVSTTPHRLRKRLTAPSIRSDSDSELSPSDSEAEAEEEEEEVAGEKSEDNENAKRMLRTPSKAKQAAALYKTPAKKSRNAGAAANQPSLIEEYFEAHSSTKVVTSDRTLQRLQTPKLDRETLFRLLQDKPSCYSAEIQRIHTKHQKHFSKWMLQLQLGFNVVVYGLGSKKALLEAFRLSQLSQELHLVVNGFFPSITLKSILNALTAEALDHQGTFRNPSDQIEYISQTLKDSPDLHIYLLIHNIDGPMLRGEKTQSALGHLASLPNMHLVASIDHINAPLVWDQCKQSQFNWLWWECVTYQRYVEETSYENSLLVQQTGALALSSLTHVLRSLTSNARGIFKLLVEFQLENRDNPSYTGLSFQDFYQRCREAFLVNSDLTLRTQLTEFRDHKLIRTRKGADGVEYLLVPVETSTLLDFVEKEGD